MSTLRSLAAMAYYYSARVMPLWWDWQYVYVMRCRFFMEQRTVDSWPWRWVGYEENVALVSGFGTPIEKLPRS